MAPDEPDPAPQPPDPAKLGNDPAALREAHRRYGDYLKQAGLPFEDEEFEETAAAPATDGDADQVGDHPAGEGT